MGKQKSFSKVIELAYCNIFGVDKTNCQLPEHKKNMDEALYSVWAYEGLYPGETEEDRDFRSDLPSPAQGEYGDLANHLKRFLPQNELNGLSSFEIIFYTYKRMMEGAFGQEKVDSEPEVTSSDNKNNEKEVPNMGQDNQQIFNDELNPNGGKTAEELLREHEEALNGGQVPTDIKDDEKSEGSKPESNDAAKMYTEAAREVVASNLAERKLKSANFKLVKGIIGQPPAVNRAVEGENAMGYIFEPAEAFRQFKKKFGAVEAADGTVSFTHCAPGWEKDAEEIYNVLAKARETKGGEPIKLSAYLGKSLGTFVAFVCQDDKGKEFTISASDLADFLRNEACGFIGSQVGNVQATVAKYTKKAKTKKGSDGKDIVETPVTVAFKVNVTGRNVMQENNMVDYVENIDVSKANNTSERQGFRSELFAKYHNPEKKRYNKDGKELPVYLPYRIPIVVLQYNLDLVDAYKDFKRKTRTTEIYDPNSESSLSKAAENLIKLIADAAAIGTDNAGDDGSNPSMLDQVRKKANEKADAFNEELASALGV